MKLEKFKEKNKKKIGIIVFTITCIMLVTGVILYRTFAIFETNEKFNVINGSIEDVGDIYFAFYKDGMIQKEMPTKEEGYILDENQSYCGVLGNRDEKIKVSLTEDNILQVKGMNQSRTKCNLYFIKGAYILGKAIPAVTESDGLYELNYEENGNHMEFRYAGKNPDNYVWFNNELWRIIGLIDTSIGKRIKLIKKDSLVNEISFDTNNSNIWDDSSLKKILNGDYYNKNGTYQTTGLNEEAKSQIEKLGLYVGKVSYSDTVSVLISERKSISSDTFVGIMSASDCGFAVSGSIRKTCLEKNIRYYGNECATYNWLFDEKEYQRTISTEDQENAPRRNVYTVHPLSNSSGAYIGNDGVSNSRFIKPTVYLKTSIKILNGEGTESQPWILSK